MPITSVICFLLKKQLSESIPNAAQGKILDSYVLEFFDLPERYSENNLKKAIVGNLKNFILEFGKDFTFKRKIENNSHAPAGHTAEEEYLLSSKLFCRK